MTVLDWLSVVVVLVLLVAWSLSYSAARLDRLHARVEGTLAALDAQLVRRAEATLELVNSGALDPASALMLADAAAESLAFAALEDTAHERQVFTTERGSAESDLTEALELSLSPETVAAVREGEDDLTEVALHRVNSAASRVQLARRFHNDAVTEARRVRRLYVVKLFRLAGHAAMPQTVEFADEVPSGLRA
ncbi:MAG: hypothetical protein V9G08_09265 [Dermatophilaceae bacterium]